MWVKQHLNSYSVGPSPLRKYLWTKFRYCFKKEKTINLLLGNPHPLSQALTLTKLHLRATSKMSQHSSFESMHVQSGNPVGFPRDDKPLQMIHLSDLVLNIAPLTT